MFKNYIKIYIAGDLGWEQYEAFALALDAAESAKRVSPILIHLSSDGGDPLAAIAISERIRLSKKDITVLGTGNIASAAVLILAAGDRRIMTKNSWVMVHEDSGEQAGSTTDWNKVAKQMEKWEAQWSQLMSEYTTTDYVDWRKMHKRTTYLTAAECEYLGLVDEVI